MYDDWFYICIICILILIDIQYFPLFPLFIQFVQKNLLLLRNMINVLFRLEVNSALIKYINLPKTLKRFYSYRREKHIKHHYATNHIVSL